MSQYTSPEQLAAQAQQKRLRRSQKNRAPQRRSTTLQLSSPSQRQGAMYEQRAIHYLQQQGVRILKQNLKGYAGEIDIVATYANQLIFIEVRQRSSQQYGGAIYSVHPHKQQRIKRTAQQFLPALTQHYFNNQTPYCRFDVIAIEGDNINWLTNVFQ